MSIDPDLRIALAFLLLLRLGVGIFFGALVTESGVVARFQHQSRQGLWADVLIWMVLSAPVLLFVVDPFGFMHLLRELGVPHRYSLMWLPDALRIWLLFPAMIGMLLVVWSYLSAVQSPRLSGQSLPEATEVPGPFRVIRFPQWTGEMIFFGAMILATANWVSLLALPIAGFMLHALVPRLERAWQDYLGEKYEKYRAHTGVFLPQTPKPVRSSGNSYVVPKRFGMAAIIGLITLFAVIFGAINFLQARIEFDVSPTLHIFFGMQLIAIWIGQMQFGESPRSVSAVIGAILLPAFTAATLLKYNVAAPAAVIGVLLVLGATIGYCLGALAAGLFLVIDWVGVHFSRTSVPNSNPVAK